MKNGIIVLCLIAVAAGCYKPYDKRVNTAVGVRSDSLGNNVIIRPISEFVSFLIGEGIVVNEIKEVRTPEGFLEVQVGGFNESMSKKRFEYRPEWLDANGMLIDSVTSKWEIVSVPPKSEYRFKVTATTMAASDFRINTRTVKGMDK